MKTKEIKPIFLFMLAERLIHSMKYHPTTRQFKSELNKEIQPKFNQYAYYRKRAHETDTPILRAKYADIAWIGLQEYGLLLDAIESYNQSFSLLLEKNQISILIKYLIRSIHLLYNLSINDEKLKINTFNLVIDSLDSILKKNEIIWIRTTSGIFSALLAEDLKNWEGIEWLKLCSLVENAIQSLSINELSRKTFEDLLKICKSRV